MRSASGVLRQRDAVIGGIVKQLRMIQRGTVRRGMTGKVTALKKLGRASWALARKLERSDIEHAEVAG